MRRGVSPKKESRPLGVSEHKKQTSSEEFNLGDDNFKNFGKEKGGSIQLQALANHPQHLNNLHIPKPPKGHQKPVHMPRGGKTKVPDGDGNPVRGLVAHPVQQNLNIPPLNGAGAEGIRFDDHGMVLPHSILGTLEDFRNYLEAKGETDLAKRIPQSQKDAASEAPGRPHSDRTENASDQKNIQSNALQHWYTHMRQRRRQQDFLSDLLDRPVENLLMNETYYFREIQEWKEYLNQLMPLIHSGYGYRVGSEFWSLPQRYGDEMSGITATLTKTEQGRRKPITYVGQPSSIRQESGLVCPETLYPSSQTWDSNVYMQQQWQMLREVLKDMDRKRPDINGLEVIGSGKPFSFVTVCQSPSLEKEDEQNKEMKKEENLDPLAQYEDVVSDALLIPALRFCGQLAKWTGNFASSQEQNGDVGISATIIFEAPTGDRASSHLELHNEGSTAIFYSWEQLPVPHSFPNLHSQRKSPNFYFSSSSGVILPGETQKVEFVFKSEEPGIKTEIWQLNTHPVLLQGAKMQVTLKGVALYQDKTADQRLFIETKLEKIVTGKMCRAIVQEVLQGVHTPERPSTPVELYITKEEEFVRQNTKLQYFDEPVEALRRLWHEVNPGCTWDLSVDTLRQAVLSLPEHESIQDTISREKSLTKLNSLLLQLSEPFELKHHLTVSTIGEQLWRKLLDTMDAEAMWLRNLLGLQGRETWVDKKDECFVSDTDLAENVNIDEKSERKGGTIAKEERSGLKSRLKGNSKGESKSATTEKSVEESKKKGKKKDDVGKGKDKERQGKESALLGFTHPDLTNQQPPKDQNLEAVVINIYMRLLHKKVYALMEDLVDTLCDLMDEGNKQDTLTEPH
ncbi:hypothetical protein Q5P01_026310 [Channa striata]|uniref:MYCBP-associated protein n=1 Tax=Channa striata TaxID=64152 RepID=A0AA88IJY6_CHASR|nr:hypothetical protein Q5P01_026310 [Channa striata]